MSVTSNVSGVYAYNGSLASLGLGSVLNVNVANFGSTSSPGQFIDNNGQLTQSDDGVTTFSLNGGPPQPIDYIGSGTVATLGVFGIRVDPRPVAFFSVDGQIYFYAPEGMPILSGLLLSVDINPNAPFPLPASPDGNVDGLDTSQNMGVGYTDLQGDQITNNADQIYGNGGNDTISAGGGNDTVFGGSGNDKLFGDAGDDVLSGDEGDDTLEGGLGNDQLFGGAGQDLLDGGDGDDTLDGGDGNDTLIGWIGNDVLSGGAGNDLIYGGDGNDTITSGNGVDNVYAGSGDDTVILVDGQNGTGSFLDGGDGFDTLDLRDAGPRRVVLDDGNPNNGTVLWLDGDGNETGLSTRFENFENVVCFATGTRMVTKRGKVAVEDLEVGDMVLTYDNGYQPIRWIGAKFVSARHLNNNDLLKPVRIRAGSLGNGLPDQDLTVTRQHRVLVKSQVSERMFGCREILVPAKDLRGAAGVELCPAPKGIEYWHMLFDDHQIVFSELAPTESLFLGPQAELMVGPEAMEEIRSLFPELEKLSMTLARLDVRGNKARRCVSRVESNGKVLLDATIAHSLERAQTPKVAAE